MQGASLAPLIRLLKLRPAARHTMSEHEARAQTFGASLAALEQIGKRASGLERATLERLRAEYRIRVSANQDAHTSGVERVEDRARFLRVELELVSVSRATLLDLISRSCACSVCSNRNALRASRGLRLRRPATTGSGIAAS